MKLLAIESSSLVASAAIMENDTLVAEYTINNKMTHSQTLLPMISEICRITGLDLSTLDAIAVAGGPGSFTGLRIGSATVKGLGLALDKPVVSVPTIDAMACNICYTPKLIVPIMDARRDQVYTGIYRCPEEELEIVQHQCAQSLSDLMKQLANLGEPVIFLGDGVPVFRDRILEQAEFPVSFAPAHLSRQRAGAVALLGMKYYARGQYTPARDHRPEYLRLSQAEREKQEGPSR